jgi:cysteine desulfurase / selenocysteine lyase
VTNPILEFREDFPAFENCIYMNLSGRGLLSRTTRAALDGGLDDQMMGRVQKSSWKAAADDARRLFARIIHARANEIACMKNVSDGLNAIATALPWKRGDNLVYCPDFDHPNATFAWLNFQNLGVELRPVPLLACGALDVSGIRRAMDGKTRLVTLSSVNFLTGMRAELGEIGACCRRNGVFFLVDGAQSTGVLDVDVYADCIDGWCASANKGLLGTYGVGLTYCSEEWASRLKPMYLSRFGVDAGELPESEMGPADYKLYSGARRFEVGNANWTGLIAVATSMRQLQQYSAADTQQQALSLALRLAAGIREAGFAVPSSTRSELRSHIVTIYEGPDGGRRLEDLDQNLRAERVVFSRRLGAIRFGLHAYNNMADIDFVVRIATNTR